MASPSTRTVLPGKRRIKKSYPARVQPLGRADARIIALIFTAIIVGIGLFGILFHAIGVRAALAAEQPLFPSLTSSSTVTLMAVGDIMLSRNAGSKMISKKDYNYPFLKTRDFLKKGDIVFGNLETAITPGRPIKTGEFSFRSDPEVAPAMKRGGFSVVSLANNHSPNFGAKGLADTVKYLNQAGIRHSGAGANLAEALKPATVTVKDTKFAFLAFNDSDVVPASYGASATRAGTALMDIPTMTTAVKSAKKRADAVVVSMHSGTEYKAMPNVRQQKFARAAIDAGAAIVIGHHPHVVQTVEKYKGKYIIYSLGNFIFDQMWSRETRQGMIAKIIFTGSSVTNVAFTPVLIEDYAQPRVLTGSEAKTVMARLKL